MNSIQSDREALAEIRSNASQTFPCIRRALPVVPLRNFLYHSLQISDEDALQWSAEHYGNITESFMQPALQSFRLMLFVFSSLSNFYRTILVI